MIVRKYLGAQQERICQQCRRCAGDAGLTLGLGKSSGVGNGNPLQCFCLEDSMDRGA